jgi:hypothetical protein
MRRPARALTAADSTSEHDSAKLYVNVSFACWSLGVRGGWPVGASPELVASSLGSSECSGDAPPRHRRYPKGAAQPPGNESGRPGGRPLHVSPVSQAIR